jgi:hypothetical protein
MFDCDLNLGKLYSLHHQAKKFLLHFRARVIEPCAHITTRLLDSRSQCGLAPSSLSPLLKWTQPPFQALTLLLRFAY